MSQFQNASTARERKSRSKTLQTLHINSRKSELFDRSPVHYVRPMSANIEQFIRMTLAESCVQRGNNFIEMEALRRNAIDAIQPNVLEKFGWSIFNSRIEKIGRDLHFFGAAVAIDVGLVDCFESAGLDPAFSFRIQSVLRPAASTRTLVHVVDPQSSQIDYSAAVSEPVNSVSWDVLNKRIAEHLFNMRDRLS